MHPLPPMHSLPDSNTNNCHGGQNESYSTGYHPLDQIHKITNNQQHNNAAAARKKRSHRDKHCDPDVEQMQNRYLHHKNGFSDLSDCNGSRVHPHNQQVNQSRGYHPSKALYHENSMTDPNDCRGLRVDPFNQQVNQSRGSLLSKTLHHEKGLTDLNDYNSSRGYPFNPANDSRDGDCGNNNRELLHEAPYGHQQSTYNSKISHTSGVKHGHSANRCQEANEPNKGHQDHSRAQYHDYNSTHPQQKVSLRHQSQGTHPSLAKSRSNNQSDNSKGRHIRSECDSDGVSYDQLSPKDRRNDLKHQRQDQAIHTGGSEIAVEHEGADSAQFHEDPNNQHNIPNSNQQDDSERNYHEIKGLYPMSDQPNVEGREREKDAEYGEEGTDMQAQQVYVEGNSDQEFDEQGDRGQKQLGNQETRHERQQQTQRQYNAVKQPRQVRKAQQKSNRTGGEGNPVRKRSATYPPIDRAGVTKGERNKKKSQTVTNGGSHIPIPGKRHNQKFSKPATNQYPNATKSTSRNNKFSRRLPLPPISNDLSKDYIAKKSSTKVLSKSQSQVKRPSTQQGKHTSIATLLCVCIPYYYSSY